MMFDPSDRRRRPPPLLYPASGRLVRLSEAVRPMAEAYEMKVMWRAVSTTFTFRQQRLTKVILKMSCGKLSIISVRYKKIENSWNNIIFAYFINLN